MMNTYAVKCTCGDEMKVQAVSMDEAKMKLKEMMTGNDMAGAKAHWADKHATDTMPMPTMDQVNQMVDAGTYQVM